MRASIERPTNFAVASLGDARSLMSVVVAGYALRKLLRASVGGRVHEAEHLGDGRRAIAKVFALLDEHAEARVRHEFELLRELDVEGVVRPLALERSGDELVLLLEYVPGRSLAAFAGNRPLSPARFLPKAIELAAILGRVHARRVIHRDIKPSNVLVEADSERILLADFGISVLLENERSRIYEPHLLHGTLPYISPEQTGRTRREVDYRSDLYSLGATFYELLTGRPPFDGDDPLELIHAQLARPPRPLRELVPELPAALEAIVLKLLEKMPERRYQSAAGLRADLERLANALAAGEREPSFPLDERALPSVLQFPHRLYGRAPERAVLVEQFNQVLARFEPRVVLIAGEPGMGKSALIRDFEAPLLVRGGYIGVGKYEIGHRVVPYAGFTQALTTLVTQLLTESDARIVRWREALLEGLGPLAAVAVTLVPKLGFLLGELPEPPALELNESRNRLHRTLVRLVRSLAARVPLVLVLDDLQWADAGSFELLETLGVELQAPVLLVGAYRSNEREPGGRLDQAIMDLTKRELPLVQLNLSPLTDEAAIEMLCDTVREGPEAVATLAELTARKTDNNPLFIRQFLNHLVDLDLLSFRGDAWTWEVEAIARAGVPNDVLGVMVAKLERLPAKQRTLLELGSCIGARFELPLLQALLDGEDGNQAPSLAALTAELYALERAGLIIALEAGYQFVHDRVQEAAGALLEPEAGARVHARIGVWLLDRARAELGEALGKLGDDVFVIVDHLDAGRAAGSIDDELLATLAIRAGDRALNTAAWRSARRYFELALELLADELAEVRRRAGAAPPTRLVRACFGHTVALDLCKDFEGANRGVEELLTWELPELVRAELIGQRTRILATRGAAREAIAIALDGLARLGWKLSREPSQLRMVVGLVLAWRQSQKLGRAGLLELADTTDERTSAAMYILCGVKNAAYEVDPKFFVSVVSAHARMLMGSGFHPSAVEGLTQLAFTASAFAAPDEVAQLCATIVELGERRGASAGAMTIANFSRTTLIAPWHKPFRACLDALPGAYHMAVETGERIMAGAVGSLGLTLHLAAGTHLDEFPELIENFSRDNEDWGTPDQAFGALAAERLVEALRGVDEGGPGLVTRAEILPSHGQMIGYVVSTLELCGRWLLGQREGTWDIVEALADDYDQAMFGLAWPVSRFALLSGLLALERAAEPHRGWRERRRLVRFARKQAERLSKWARGCADNFQPMADLLLGELAATRNDARAALDRFEAAAAVARRTGVHELEAIAKLRVAALAERSGWEEIATASLRGALACFERWGARAIVARTEREHPGLNLGHSLVVGPTRAREHGTVSTTTTNAAIDMASMLDTVSALSEDLRLDEVVARVLRAAVANAGADRGVLLLERDTGVILAAEIDTRDAEEFSTPNLALPEAGSRLPLAIVNLVLRSGEALVIDELGADPRFAGDPYVAASEVRSLLCMPVVKRNQRVGALLLENHLGGHVFTTERLEVLRVLMDQAAGILENARLYTTLGRSEARWRSVVGGASDLIVLMDRDGVVEFVNRPNTLVDEHDFTASLEPETRSSWDRARAEVLADEGPRQLELRLRALGQQEPRWFALRLSSLRLLVDDELSGQQSTTTKLLVIATDISERRALEAQLRQQQRLEAIGTLAAGVAHEINNPIQGIMNYAELLGSLSDKPEEVRELAGEIDHETKRITALVRNLLSFSRSEAVGREVVARERVEVAAIVEATLSLIRAVLRKDGIVLELDIPAELPMLHCCPQQIQQILMNLVVNARDALAEAKIEHERRTITIRASSFTREGSPWVRISVIDRGPGIPAEVCARIFEPFYTTKPRERGTGLGLAVSHGIAVEHGGSLSVESEPGVGTSFHLDLPMTPMNALH